MGRKKHEEHENLERWLVSYADFITLMFAFFVVLWATGQADQEKLKKAMGSMNEAFGGGMSNAILDVLSFGTLESGLPSAGLSRESVSQPELDNLMRNLTGSLSDHTVQIGLVDQKLSIVLPEELMFRPGSADLHPVSFRTLSEIAAALSGSQVKVQVIGHADGLSLPPGARFRDNWELASARANATVRYLQDHGMRPEQLVASAATTSQVGSESRVVRLVVTVEAWGEAFDVVDRLGQTEAGRRLQGEPPSSPEEPQGEEAPQPEGAPGEDGGHPVAPTPGTDP
jgi:chemotaxis protein MotB